MRFSTSGSLRRLDISLLVDAVGPLRGEWAALRFDADGNVVNPVSGAPLDTFRLLEGRHRAQGARYELITRVPETRADPALARALDAETFGVKSADIDWDDHARRRAEIETPTGEMIETSVFMVVRSDDHSRLAVTFHDLAAHWAVDVDVVHGRLPRLELSGALDATALMRAEGVPRWLGWIVGGTASGTATVDLAALEARKQTLAEGAGRFNRFRGGGSVTLRTSARSWDVDAKAHMKSKGLGRLAVLFLRGKITTAVDDGLDTFWRDAATAIDAVARDLPKMPALVAAEGGMEAVVHRAVWDPGYLDELGPRYGLE